MNRRVAFAKQNEEGAELMQLQLETINTETFPMNYKKKLPPIIKNRV